MHLVITLILLALVLNFLPWNWLMFVPVVIVWAFICHRLAAVLAEGVEDIMRRFDD